MADQMNPNTLHPDWQTYLQHHGGILKDGALQNFGNAEAESRFARDNDILVDLSSLALLRGEGPDTESFLQGQLTNDIHQVDAKHAQLSAYCNPKGRMFAIFLVIKRDDSYYLQLPASLADSTLKRLRMFVLRAKTKLELAPGELIRTGFSGPNAENLLRPACPQLPEQPYGCSTDQEMTVIRMPGPHPRFEIIAPIKRMTALWDSLLSHQVKLCGKSAWSWLDIMAELPNVFPETVEAFVPQMANLDLEHGVSFTKGCYPGQEIVARMHYLGRLKQRMVRGHIRSTTIVEPGMSIFSPGFPNQAAGTVVDAQSSPDGGFDLLLVAQIEAIKDGRIHLTQPDGPEIQLAPTAMKLPLE